MEVNQVESKQVRLKNRNEANISGRKTVLSRKNQRIEFLIERGLKELTPTQFVVLLKIAQKTLQIGRLSGVIEKRQLETGFGGQVINAARLSTSIVEECIETLKEKNFLRVRTTKEPWTNNLMLIEMLVPWGLSKSEAELLQE